MQPSSLYSGMTEESGNYSLQTDFSQPTCLHGVLHFSCTCQEQKKKHNQSIKNVIKVPSEARFKSLKMHYSFSPAHREVWKQKSSNNGPSLSCDAGKVPTRIISYVLSFCSMLTKRGLFHLIKYLFSCFTMQRTCFLVPDFSGLG